MRLKNWARRAGRRIARTFGSAPSNLGVGIGLFVSHLLFEKWQDSRQLSLQTSDEDDALTLEVNAAVGAAIPDPLDEASSRPEVFIVSDPLPAEPPSHHEKEVAPPSAGEGDTELEVLDAGDDILSYLVPSAETAYATVADYQVYTLEYIEPQEPMYVVREEDDDDDRGLFWLDPATVLAAGLGFFAGTNSSYDFDELLAADNTAPVAADDEGSVDEGATLTFGASSGVLSNDTDGEGDSLSVTALRTGTESGYGSIGTVGEALTGTYGTLRLESDGSYTYVADQAAADALGDGETATDSFTYLVSDGREGTDTAQLDIVVGGVNDAPTSSDDRVASDEGAPVVLSVEDFGTFSDVDGDTLAGVKINTLPAAGSLEYSSDGSTWSAVTKDQEISATDIGNGLLRFTPPADANGTPYATIGFQVSDGSSFSSSEYALTVNVSVVNDLPEAAADSLDVDEDATATVDAAAGVLSNDKDIDDDQLTVTGLHTGAAGDAGDEGVVGTALTGTYGTLTILSDGSYTYAADQPAADALAAGASATETFTYTVSDGQGGTDTAELQVALTGRNDAPAGSDDSVTMDEDTFVVLLSSDFGTFSDVDGDSLAGVRITTLESAGDLEYYDGSQWVDVVDDQLISVGDIDGWNLRYTPAADAYGEPYGTIGFEVYDGAAYSASEYTLTLNVAAVNDAPALDLKPADATGIDNTATFVEVAGADDGSAAVAFAAEGINLSDIDSSSLASLTVSIASSTVETGDRLVLGGTVIDLTDASLNTGEVTYGGTVFGYSVSDAGEDRTVVFTSLASSGGEGTPSAIAGYESLLDALMFSNTADDVADGETRAFSVSVSDGSDSSEPAGFTVTIDGTDDPSDLIFDMTAGPFLDDGTVVVDAYSSGGELLFSIEKNSVTGEYQIVGADPEDVAFIGDGVIIDTKTISGTEVVVVEEFQVRLFHYFGDVFLSLESGSYVDEATGVTTALDVALRAVVTVPENSVSEVSLTPYTESAIRLIELAAGVDELSFDVAADAGLISTYYAAAAEGISLLVGIDIVGVRATPVNDTEAFVSAIGENATIEDIESNQYGLKLAALSELVVAAGQLAKKVDYGVSSIVDGLEVSFNEDGGLDFDLISFTTTQVELTRSFTNFNTDFTYVTQDEEGNPVTNSLVTLDDDGNPVSSTIVRDAVAPETASIRLINPEAGAFFMRGYVDLVDSLNASKTPEYLEFKLIFDDVQYAASYNESLGRWETSSFDSDTNSTNPSDSAFTITSFDASTGEASWQFLLPDVVTTGTYETILVLTDAAENASLVEKSFTITDGPPELLITIADPVLHDGGTTTVTFDFSEVVTGFDLEDVFCFDAISNLVQDEDDATLWTATLEVSASQELELPMVVSVGANAVVDRTGNANITGATALYAVVPPATIVGDISIIDDTLWGTASADVIDGLTGDDILYGEGGDDLLLGHEQDDVLLGGDGNDVFLAGDGDDVVSGGVGDDIYYADAFGNFTYTQNYVVGGDGTDTADFHYSLSEYKIAFISADQLDHLNSLLGDEAGFRGITGYDLSFEAVAPVLRVEHVVDFWEDVSGQVDYAQVEEYVFADATLHFEQVFADELFGTGWVLSVAQADGPLEMDGAFDPLQTTVGIMVEGSGYGDRLIGGLGGDVLAGGGGDDVLVSLGGNDTLSGGAGDDVLIATTAATGSATEVHMHGGEGADTFVFLPEDPNQKVAVTIEDFSIDEGDLIDLSGIYHEAASGTLEALTAGDLVDTGFLDDYASYLELHSDEGYAALHLEGFVDADGDALAALDVRIDFDIDSVVPDVVSPDWFAPADSGVLSEHWWDQLQMTLAN